MNTAHFGGSNEFDYGTSGGGFGDQEGDLTQWGVVDTATLEKEREMILITLDQSMGGKWLGKFTIYSIINEVSEAFTDIISAC